MERKWWLKFAFLMICALISIGYVYPTAVDLDLSKTNFPFKQKINLGLDLQGGLYMVMGVDFNKVYRDVVSRQVLSLQDTLKEKNRTFKSATLKTEGFPPEDPRILVELNGTTEKDEIYKQVKKDFWTLRLTGDVGATLEFGLAHEYRGEVRQKTINQSIEVIRNRIDEFGVTEPVITSQGADRVIVELPGVKEIERAKDLIGRTAKLEFRIVDDKSKTVPEILGVIEEIEKSKKVKFVEGKTRFSDYVREINKHAKGKIPQGTEILFGRDEGARPRIPYLVAATSQVTGEDLADAHVQFDPTNRAPVVGFSLNPRGANSMSKLTGDHMGERMAIVLDNIVHSAPVIQGQISNSGQITLGRGNHDDLLKEAKDLAIVLRAGALPAQLEFLEQRVIGPSLGRDSIKSGAYAGTLGAVLVLFFVLVYYRVSGAIAVGSLLLNVLFVVAILIGMEATLTLPGIAGIALTVGIAVDSNVVIYERIREELRSGKAVHGAVEAGFQKALRTILDANITNALAGGVLWLYGTGPIKGFAVTLLIGIVTTVFSAVFICKLFFEFYLFRLGRRAATTLSI